MTGSIAPMPPVTVRAMRPGDVPEAAAIHVAAFNETGQGSLERAMSDVKDELGRSWARVRVACRGEQVVGVTVVWVVTDVVDVLDVATHPDHRRQGIGRALVDDLVVLARERHARRIALEVRRSNAAAIALYRQAGFAAVRVRARYYRDDEDAVEMALELDAQTGEILRRPDEVDA